MPSIISNTASQQQLNPHVDRGCSAPVDRGIDCKQQQCPKCTDIRAKHSSALFKAYAACKDCGEQAHRDMGKLAVLESICALTREHADLNRSLESTRALAVEAARALKRSGSYDYHLTTTERLWAKFRSLETVRSAFLQPLESLNAALPALDHGDFFGRALMEGFHRVFHKVVYTAEVCLQTVRRQLAIAPFLRKIRSNSNTKQSISGSLFILSRLLALQA